MKRRQLFVIVILTIILILPLLTSCTFYNKYNDIIEVNDTVKIKEVNIDYLANENVNSIVGDSGLESGVFSISLENQEYLFFNGIDCIYSNFSFKVDDEILTVSYETFNNKTTPDKVLYEIEKKSQYDYDTIILLENGKQSHFKTGYAFK